MNRRVPISAALLALVLAGCTSVSTKQIGADIPGSANEYVSACAIQGNPAAYTGKTVRVRGTYKTDTMYYAFLESEECKTPPRLIAVDHPLNTKGDQSVDAFFLIERARCKGNTVCPIAFFVDVDLLVKQTEIGLMAEFKHVHYAKART